jgi:hypothetical protein
VGLPQHFQGDELPGPERAQKQLSVRGFWPKILVSRSLFFKEWDVGKSMSGERAARQAAARGQLNQLNVSADLAEN